MNYYRKTVDNTANDLKLKMQMGALTLKLSENNGNISSNTSLIDTNKSNISSNTSLIDTNKNNISSNTSLIDTNKNNISSNTSLIDTNKNNISTLKTDVSNNYNFTQINKKKSEFNTSLIDTNRDNIASNLIKINSIEENNLKISDEVFNDTYGIINQSFNFNENSHSYKLFEKVIENSMVSGELIIIAVINYKYDNLKNDLNRLTHLYQFYDDKDNLFYSITLDNHDFSTSNFDKNILNVSDNFCFNIDNKDKIKIVLSLTRINDWGSGTINLQMIDNNNSINIIYNQKTDISNKFDDNDKKIKAIDEKILSNNNLISNNFTSILPLKSNYVIDNILLFNLNLNKDINFKSNINRILVYETNIFYQFKPNSFIEINESIAYKYDNIKLYYYVLKETYVLLDQNDIILDEFSFNIKSKGFIFNNLHIYNNQYFFKAQSDIKTLKLKVYLERINYDNDTEFNLQLNSDHQSNFICLKYFKYTS